MRAAGGWILALALGGTPAPARPPTRARVPAGSRPSPAPASPAPRSAPSSAPEDFPTRILPLLTKAGCNSGTCHGAAIGRGGFHLSLLGYDAASDHAALAREAGGRRVQLDAPAESLVLRKASGAVPHGGGVRLAKGSAAYGRLRAWIAAGAPYGEGRRQIAGLEVTPKELLLPAPGSRQPLRVVARFSDGSREDVSSLALYTSDDDSVAAVDPAGGVTVRGRGLTALMVRYLGQVAAVRAGSPFNAPGTAVTLPPASGPVDAAVFAELRRLRLPLSPPAGDAEFLRRVSLDLTGTLPTPEDVREFLSECRVQGQANSIKIKSKITNYEPAPPTPTHPHTHTAPLTTHHSPRERLVDRLLQRPEFTDYWTHAWAELLQIDSKRLGSEAAGAYHGWLREQVARNAPFDGVVRALLTTSGDAAREGPVNFYRAATDPRDLAEIASRTLLGLRVECARCHNHPFDRWTQGDYYGFAAFFARVRFDGTRLVDRTEGELEHPRTGLPVPPRPLGAPAPASGNPATAGRRAALAAWLLGSESRLLARNLANRVWQRLMGRGIVEPVDDLRVSNPPANPALLDALADELVAGGYDLRRLVRTIVTSRTYQATSRSLPGNARDDRFFSHARVRPLAPEVLADAIAQATGVPDVFSGQAPGTRAIQLLDARVPSETLDAFGRCTRETRCDPETSAGGLPAALHLINGEALQRKVATGVAARLLREGRGCPLGAAKRVADREIVEELYLRTLSRPPEPEERAHWESVLARATDRPERVEDLLWALLNCREFAFNH